MPSRPRALRVPRFEVSTMIALWKYVVRPRPSVSRASPSTWSSRSNTDGCAFSISSSSTTPNGWLRTAAVSRAVASPPSPPPPNSRSAAHGSVYSLMSRRTMRSGAPNRYAATLRASSVLPTPVGPTNSSDASGLSAGLRGAPSRRRSRRRRGARRRPGRPCAGAARRSPRRRRATRSSASSAIGIPVDHENAAYSSASPSSGPSPRASRPASCATRSSSSSRTALPGNAR